MGKLPKFTKNFYFLFILFFAIWMLFIDGNDLISQYRLGKKLKSLQAEKAYYEEKIKTVRKDREELLSDKSKLEKFAREKYLMKKESEDLFIIVENED